MIGDAVLDQAAEKLQSPVIFFCSLFLGLRFELCARIFFLQPRVKVKVMDRWRRAVWGDELCRVAWDAGVLITLVDRIYVR